MSLTFFAAPLRCPHCGRVSPEDASSEMTSPLLSTPGITELHVGDHVPVNLGHFQTAYYALRPAAPGAPVRVVERWACPYDLKANWAEVVFRDGTLESITAVPLTAGLLAGADFLTERIEDVYDWFTDEPFFTDDGERPDWRERLMRALETGERAGCASSG